MYTRPSALNAEITVVIHLKIVVACVNVVIAAISVKSKTIVVTKIVVYLARVHRVNRDVFARAASPATTVKSTTNVVAMHSNGMDGRVGAQRTSTGFDATVAVPISFAYLVKTCTFLRVLQTNTSWKSFSTLHYLTASTTEQHTDLPSMLINCVHVNRCRCYHRQRHL